MLLEKLAQEVHHWCEYSIKCFILLKDFIQRQAYSQEYFILCITFPNEITDDCCNMWERRNFWLCNIMISLVND